MELSVNVFVSLDGVMQGPGGPDEDRSNGFEYGGWLVPHAADGQLDPVDGWFREADAILLWVAVFGAGMGLPVTRRGAAAAGSFVISATDQRLLRCRGGSADRGSKAQVTPAKGTLRCDRWVTRDGSMSTFAASCNAGSDEYAISPNLQRLGCLRTPYLAAVHHHERYHVDTAVGSGHLP